MHPDDNAWYKTSFSEDYLDLYRHRDLAEARKGVSLAMRNRTLLPGSAILDLCCGSGRHLRAMQDLGLTPVGFDLSTTLLRASRHLGISAPLIQGDMRRLPFRDRTFDAVLSFFTSFGYFPTDGENLRVVQEVSRILRSGGMFLLDYLNRDHVLEHGLFSSRETSSHRVVLQERHWNHEKDTIEKKITIYPEGHPDRKKVYREEVKLYSPNAIVAFFRGVGFSVAFTNGSLDGDPFLSSSPRFILTGRKTHSLENSG